MPFIGSEIEELKMEFVDVLQKYRFLHDIIDRIFPHIFDPPNEEIQQFIRERELGREIGATELARRLNRITPTRFETDRRILKTR